MEKNVSGANHSKKDIFEEVQERVGCHFMSDLRWNQSKVREVLRELPAENYTAEQIEKLKKYVFDD